MTLHPDAHHFLIATDPGYRERWFSTLARTVAVDFDGVLHPYTKGWVGPVPADEPPTPGAREFLEALVADGYRVVIFSTRCDTPEGLAGTCDWINQHGLAGLIDNVTSQKPAAVAYVDDRAVVYRHGNWIQCQAEINRLATGRAHGAAPAPEPLTDLEIADGSFKQYLATGDSCYIDNLHPDEMRAFIRDLADRDRAENAAR